MSTPPNLDNAIQAITWFAEEPHSDHPVCVSPVIAEFGRTFHDDMRSDKERAKLVPLIPILVGTATTAEDELTRSWLAFDWLIRTHVPTWLRLAGFDNHAQRLADLPELQADVDMETVPVARIDAAWYAAWAAAMVAVTAPAYSAAGVAARSAAWVAVTAAAVNAAVDAVGTRSAATAAAMHAAMDAATAAAVVAARAAADATAALQPTVDLLQDSAIELIRRMANVGRDV